MCDAQTHYCLNSQIYSGKVGTTPERGQASRVVRELTAHLHGGYNITTDNFYTSKSLAEELLARSITTVGTLRKNKPEIPPAMLDPSGRDEGSSKFCFTRTQSMVSYIPKKGKMVILLSTMHHDQAVVPVRQ